MANIKGKQLSSNLAVTNVTASGHISASGDLTANNLNVGQYIYHIGDPNTFLNFTDDRLRFNIGGISYIDLNDASSAPHDITFNDGGNNVDFTIKGSSNNPLFKTDASTNRIGMFGVGSPTADLHIAGNLWVSGSNGHITASGDISSSASGSFVNLKISNNATVDGDLIVTENIKHKGDVNTLIRFTDNKIKLEAGGMSFVSLHDDDSAPFPAKINPNSERINFLVLDKSGQNLLKTDSDEGNTILFYSGSERLSTQAGGINITGNISASGNISGSATGTGSFAHITATSKVSGSSASTGSFGRVEIGAGGIDTAGDITLDGDGGDIILKDGGVEYGRFTQLLGGLTIKSGPAGFAAVIISSASASPTAILGVELQTGKDITGSATTTGSFGNIEAHRSITAADISASVIQASQGTIDIHSLSGYVANENIDHSSVTITAGSGLTGGGTIASTRTLAVGQGTGVTVNTNDVAIGQDVATTANVKFNHITASANISASGDVIATGTGSFGSIETTGDVNVAGRLAHTGDADTRILFTDDDINITAGGKNFVDFTEDTVSEITFNEEGVDIDFRIESAGDSKAVFIDASKNAIQFGTAATTHITASGNISASGNIMTSATASAAHILVTGIISGSQIEASGDVIAFSSSDRRFKDNLVVIEGSLDKIGKINGYEFDWNDKQTAYKGHDIGVVAQEIEAVLPEVVTTRGDGYKAVKYDKIVPLLIESIKELQKKVEDIEKNCDCLNK